MAETACEMTFENCCNQFRKDIKATGDSVAFLKTHSTFRNEQSHDNQHGEMKANIMLAYRHLEDARMRIGKVLQAYQGGVSIFDKQKVVDLPPTKPA